MCVCVCACVRLSVSLCVSFILFRIPFITISPHLLQGTEEIGNGSRVTRGGILCKAWSSKEARGHLVGPGCHCISCISLLCSGVSWQFEWWCEWEAATRTCQTFGASVCHLRQWPEWMKPSSIHLSSPSSLHSHSVLGWLSSAPLSFRIISFSLHLSPSHSPSLSYFLISSLSLLFSHHLSFFSSNFSVSLFWSLPLSFLNKILSIPYLFAKFSFTWRYRAPQADASVSLASLTRNLSCTFSSLFHSRVWLTAKSKNTRLREALEIQHSRFTKE